MVDWSKNGNLIKVTDVVILKERGRKSFTNIQELAENIKRHGLLHPIVVEHGTNHLIAGERRLRACTMLPVLWNKADEERTSREHPVRSILDGFLPYTTRNGLPAEQLKEIELDENVQRVELEWPEKIALMEQAHELKTKIYGPKTANNQDGHTLQKLADSTGESIATVSTQVKFAKQLIEAKKLDSKIVEKLRNLPLTAAIKEFSRMEVAKHAENLHASGLLKFDSTLLEGDALELIKNIESNSIDCLLSDPPFGIPELTDATGVGRGDSNSYTATLSVDDNLDKNSVEKLIKRMAPELFRVLKPSGHFWIFFAWEVYDCLKSEMQKAGFDVCPVPAIWDKKRSTSPFRGYEPAPCYEPILFGHKPPRSKKLNESCRMVFDIPIIASVNKIHRFEKPQELLTTLVSLSTNKGDIVLDPFAGSASTLIACKQLSRSGIGFEKNNQNFLRAQARLVCKE